MDNQRQHTANDWDWWALRYLANELADDESRWFERQLLEHEAACQALAGAVELTCAVAVAERSGVVSPVPASRHRAWYRTPVAHWAGGVAAGLLIAVGYWQFQPLRPAAPADSPSALARDEESMAEDVPAEELAYAWWQTQLEAQAADDGIGLDPRRAGETLTPSDLLTPQEAQLAPDWMLSALAAGDDEAMDESEDTDSDEDAETEAETVEG